MAGSLLGVGCRSLVAAVFVMTAFWKLSNRYEFESSFRRLAPERLEGLAPVAVGPLAALELVLAGVLGAGARVHALSLAGPIAAFVLVSIFTVALALGDEGGCGCWATPPASARMLRAIPVWRNLLLLIVLSAAAILSPDGIRGASFADGIPPFITGLLFAVLLVEAPQIVSVVTFHSGTPNAGATR